MRTRTSTSVAMVLSQKRVECSLQVGKEALPLVEEFKEINRWIRAASAVMRLVQDAS